LILFYNTILPPKWELLKILLAPRPQGYPKLFLEGTGISGGFPKFSPKIFRNFLTQNSEVVLKEAKKSHIFSEKKWLFINIPDPPKTPRKRKIKSSFWEGEYRKIIIDVKLHAPCRTGGL
jgi:hypothetical protein